MKSYSILSEKKLKELWSNGELHNAHKFYEKECIEPEPEIF